MEKKIFVITILSLFAIFTCSAQNDSSRSKDEKKKSNSMTAAPLKFSTFKDTVSYLIGTDLAKNFKNNQLDIDINYLKAGYENVLNNVDTIFTEQEFQAAMQKLQKIAMEKSEAKRLEEAKLNKEVGQKFLESNKNNPGVYQTPSGLQYKVIKMGEGPKPTSTDKVKVHYEIFKEYKYTQKIHQQATTRQWEELVQLRITGDKIIKDLWDEIEAHFQDLHPYYKLERCKEYGVVYYYRKGEPEITKPSDSE